MKTDNHRRGRLKREQENLKIRKKRRNNRQARLREVVSEQEGFIFLKKDMILARTLVLVLFLLVFSSSEKLRITKPCFASADNGISMAAPTYKELLNPLRYLKIKDENKKPEIGKITPVAESDEALNRKIKAIVKEAPMKEMVDEIAKRDKPVAAFLVGIAMKESKFGTYSPKKDGKDCYNYWGYRGKENTTKSGYSCFDSPEHAVRVVGDRIESLVKNGRTTPAKMIVWKCGSSCAGHGQESVDKWIADVSIHYYGLLNDKELAKK